MLFNWRYFVCLPMLVILPVSLLAGDAAGMLRTNATGVLVNRNPAPASIALFPNDLIETDKAAVARIEETGSTADINPETMVQYEATELSLDHGSLAVNTSRGLRVRVGCVTVTPVNDAEWTRYEVVDMDGKVTVSALNGDVYIDARSGNSDQARQPAHSNRVIVHEGEKKSREEKCVAADLRTQGNPVPFLDSSVAKWGAIGVVSGVTCWALCRNPAPISPEKP